MCITNPMKPIDTYAELVDSYGTEYEHYHSKTDTRKTASNEMLWGDQEAIAELNEKREGYIRQNLTKVRSNKLLDMMTARRHRTQAIAHKVYIYQLQQKIDDIGHTISTHDNELQNMNEQYKKILELFKQYKRSQQNVLKTEEDSRADTKHNAVEDETKKSEAEKQEDLTAEEDEIFTEMKTRLKSMDSIQQRLCSQIETLQKTLDKLKEPEKKEKNHCIVNVQLLQTEDSELVNEAVSELKSYLQGIYSEENKELNIISVPSPCDIQNNMPLLVTCPNISRLGTDAETAIRDITGTTKTALLIFHHKDVNQVSHTASRKLLTSKTFESVNIFDFMFLSQNGIYSCKENESSITELRKFINVFFDEQFVTR